MIKDWTRLKLASGFRAGRKRHYFPNYIHRGYILSYLEIDSISRSGYRRSQLAWVSMLLGGGGGGLARTSVRPPYADTLEYPKKWLMAHPNIFSMGGGQSWCPPCPFHLLLSAVPSCVCKAPQHLCGQASSKTTVWYHLCPGNESFSPKNKSTQYKILENLLILNNSVRSLYAAAHNDTPSSPWLTWSF